MKHSLLSLPPTFSGMFLVSATMMAAEPRVDSWSTSHAGQYARLYTSDANKASGNAVSTWSNGTFTQSLPAYCGVQEIYPSSNWVYIRSTGLGSHIMGPWYLNAAHTQVFPNWPVNTKAFYRIPRTPAVPAGKSLTGLGAIGYFVDGVAMFDCRDGFAWTGAAESNMGTGYWRREAYVNEGVTFDPGYAHQPQDGTHHYHAQPIALRHLLGDHVDFHAATRTYAESAGPITKHSPILGWVRDGFPIYGPYGYASASNAASGVRRMVSGYQLRDGARGTDNLNTAGRSTLPAWAVRFYNVAPSQAGPAVSTAYPLGRYMEDNAYLGDLGFTKGVDFDLDEHNGRWCVTPEFPGGTYAYFTAIGNNGAPVFPYNIGAAFYGTPAGAAVTTLTEAVVTNFLGGPNLPLKLNSPALAGDQVTLTWRGVEGGRYRVESTGDFAGWATNSADLAGSGDAGSFVEAAGPGPRFYRVARTSLASFDPVTGTTPGTGNGGILSVSPSSAARGSTITLTINLNPAAQPPPPPANAPVNSVTVGAIAASNRVHVSQTQVAATLTIPAAAAPGGQTLTVIFPGPPSDPSATVVYALENGFTIQ